jgi:hypothetical protein
MLLEKSEQDELFHLEINFVRILMLYQRSFCISKVKRTDDLPQNILAAIIKDKVGT